MKVFPNIGLEILLVVHFLPTFDTEGNKAGVQV